MTILEKFIAVDLEKCTGCRSCEMACSFHFEKSFSRKYAAIQINRNDKYGEISVTLSSECDLCAGESEPLCLWFCEPHAIFLVDKKRT